MARIEGASGVLAEIDAGSLAQRVSLRPTRTLAWNSLGAQTGLLTGIVAGGRIFSLRNNHASNLILVRRVGLGIITTTAFTAAQLVEFGLLVGRAFTVSDTVGTDITPLTNNTKHRASLAVPNVQGRISATAVVSGGTITTPDANYVGITGLWSSAVGVSLTPSMSNLLEHPADDLPLVLAANEGVVIQNITLMGAAGVVKAYINIEYAEIAAADFA